MAGPIVTNQQPVPNTPQTQRPQGIEQPALRLVNVDDDAQLHRRKSPLRNGASLVSVEDGHK
jgi:hypothetical protein